ncbi:SDR family NAD(P)-dependent oxidoreductase [Cellulomonas dongxiuzhuiae]|uniref:SDR family oxidoreductase n=1 Tax=Cellulomonas dongxiuzhuiae TaxID=2819979 RepID=A0ABX8GHG6_9CELL|nr:SDR family oxidoreductase [Cellulomonas dongxiuzhuiae]MBO3094392.1 SDR family oxidoreductase [Cellulomonas dongxiuzhuiae]QWC15420.1 SDR family oxidoreductase [Cellulomonas dongxiuzhuiae]
MQGLGEGRVYLVTGGAGGIGRATAEVLARAGGRVVVTDVDEAAGTQAAEDVARATGGTTRFDVLDVADPDAVRGLADRLDQEGWPVHGLMANAGIAPSSPATEYPDELWRRTVGINLDGVFWCCRDFGRRMVERGAGTIVITSSIAGYGVVSPETHAAYGATKAAVGHLAELLGVEWARTGVRVNSVAPGYTATPILDRLRDESPDTYEQWLARIPAGRLNTPAEIANATAFLMSDLASGVTGAVLRVDGGYGAR